MKLAIIRNNKIENIIVAELDWAQSAFPDALVLEATTEVLEQYEFRPSAPTTKMSKYAFRKRFTLDELMKFDNPELFVPDMTPEQKAMARTMLKSFELANDIDLTDQNLIYGLSLMVSLGLLTSERKAQILDPFWNPA